MINKINNLIYYINDKDSIFHKKLIAIAGRLSDPFHSMEIDLKELMSIVDPELADKDIKIPEVKIEL